MTGIGTEAVIEYEGPTYDEGWVEIGLGEDGGTHAVRIADDDGRPMNGLVFGDSGMGRSGVLTQVALGAVQSQAFRVMFTDGDRSGASALDRFGRGMNGLMPTAHRQVGALEDLVVLRLDESGWRGFAPSPERPGLVWLIKGLDELLRNDTLFGRRLDAVLRRAVKAGIGVWGMTRGYELSADFGGFADVRAKLSAENCVAFPSTSQYGYLTSAGYKVDARVLPHTPGYAALALPHGLDEIRTKRVTDPQRWVDAAQEPEWDHEAAAVLARHGLAEFR